MPDCLFCNIVRGFAPAERIHENDEFIAIADLYPVAPVHVLVIPRVHARDLDAWVADGQSGESMLQFVADTARMANIAGQYRLLTNIGADAGQAIFHLHWHLLGGAELAAF